MSNFVESFRYVIKVTSVETCNGDTSISCHVNGVFLAKCGHLLLIQSSVGKHTDLACSVAPVVLVAEIL